MNKIVLLFGLSLNFTIYFSQSLESNKVNIATLIVDYDTYDYEGGNISSYDCNECSNDSLPFVSEFTPPGDFGGIKFNLLNEQTIFDASIIWMGTGNIALPSSFNMNFPFNETTENYLLPTTITYYGMSGNIDNTLINEANLAIQKIRNLPIVQEFSNVDTKLGIYFYPPTVGALDPSVAKWIIFLYSKTPRENTLMENENLAVDVYPNPIDDVINVEIKTIETKSNFSLFNSLGELIFEDYSYQNKFKIITSGLKSGFYVLKINSDTFIKIYKN